MPHKKNIPAATLKVFETVPDLYLILSPELQILTASNAYLEATGRQKQEICGKHLFDLFPGNPETQKASPAASFNASFRNALANGKPVTMAEQRFDITRVGKKGEYEEQHMEPVITPVTDENKDVIYIIFKLRDVSRADKQQQQITAMAEKEQHSLKEAEWLENRIKEFIMQAPVAIGIFEGADHVIELANPLICEIMGRSARDVVGKPVFEALPELKTTEYEAILSKVYKTGEAIELKEGRATLMRNGKLVTGFFHTVYQPLKNAKGEVTGIINIVYDVSEQVEGRIKIEQLNSELEERVMQRTQELQAAQAQIEAERNILQIIFDQAPVAISLFKGQELEVVTANKLICDMWGYSPEQVLNRPLLEGVPELKGQGFDDILRNVLNTGKLFIGKEMAAQLLENGKPETKYFNFVYQPLYGAEGEILGVVDVVIEITELVLARKAAEERENKMQALNKELAVSNEELKATNEELAETQAALEQLNNELEERVEERTIAVKLAKAETERQVEVLHALFMQAPAPIVIMEGEQLVFRLVNPAYQQIFPDRKLQGKAVLEALPEIKGTQIEDILKMVYQTGEAFVAYEMPIMLARHKGGELEEIHFTFIYQARRNQQGEIDGVLVFAHEVTEQVNARRKIEENEQHTSRLLEGIPQMTWTNLPNGQVNFYSQHWFEYTGLTHEQLQGWGWKSIVHPGDLKEMLPLYLQSLETETEFKHENRIKGSDGTWRWFLNHSVPLEGENGKPVLWVGTSTDIHAQKQAEEALHQISRELAATNEELQAANEEIKASHEDLADSNQQLQFINADMDNFIYTASHDLRAPISNIEGLMSAIIRNLPKESRELPVIQKLSGLVIASIERFKNTLKELTNITQLQREEGGEGVTEVDFSKMTEEVRLDLAPQIEEADARIIIDFQDCTPIRFSGKNLRSIVYNLISNAIKYRSPNRQPIIQIACYHEGEYQVYSVTDNGLGMDLSEENKIFAMFRRLHDHVEGTGVGLYIVKKILENCGGKIEVESKPGEGSVFKAFFF